MDKSEKAMGPSTPEGEKRAKEVAEAIATLREIGARAKARGLTLQDLLSARHEGHKY